MTKNNNVKKGENIQTSGEGSINKKSIQGQEQNRTRNKKEIEMPFEFFDNEAKYISKTEISESTKEKIAKLAKMKKLGSRVLWLTE